MYNETQSDPTHFNGTLHHIYHIPLYQPIKAGKEAFYMLFRREISHTPIKPKVFPIKTISPKCTFLVLSLSSQLFKVGPFFALSLPPPTRFAEL
ncbi:hypothetical protein L6452_32236 [Arctium lappa]|uniref:Uncharacterized protein n=1 Tax=Arctium lappa TaxID=4217 RepID=A0ACB8Z3Z9_ARCLA|nr:hypothetical protein L6452_32236 [Arctium lappa]